MLFILQALNKKENKGGQPGSPEGGDSDGEGGGDNLTPRTEARYNKINQEFEDMTRNQLNGGNRVSETSNTLTHVSARVSNCCFLQTLHQGFASMPVSVPVNSGSASESTGQFSGGGGGGSQATTTAAATSATTAASSTVNSGEGQQQLLQLPSPHHSAAGSPRPSSGNG